MNCRWQLLAPPPQSFLDEQPELPRLIATLLFHRGILSPAARDEFLSPEYEQDVHDPFLFKDMDKAVSRIERALAADEKIVIYGDYDADGVCAAVILTSLFQALLYANFEVYLPHRETEGYGLNEAAVRALAQQNTKLIITCDCGISNRVEIELAKNLGIEVIVTDHHSVPESLPPAYAIIHPKVPNETYPDKTLSGGAVAFKLCQGVLCARAKANECLPNGERHAAFAKWLLDLVAISSVADMVPLLGESRTLTKYGLIVLNKTKRIGLQKLLLEARLMSQDGGLKRPLDAQTIGFHIAPRINAAGRMNHANVAYRLLTTTDPIEAVDLAYELNQNNQERQKLTEEYVKEALAQLPDGSAAEEPGDGPMVRKEQAGAGERPGAHVLFVYSARWPTGVIGLIAGRIKERFGQPVVALTQKGEEIMGSGRSIAGFNMIAALQTMPECFSKFGGHPMACGFTLHSPDMLEIFKDKLNQMFVSQTAALDTSPSLTVDAALPLEEVTWELYDILETFSPFGQANPRPRYLARQLKVIKLEPVGKDRRHLRLLLASATNQVRKAIGWNLCGGNGTDWSKALLPGNIIDMVFEVEANEWNGNRELQLTVVDLRKSETTKPPGNLLPKL